MRWFAHNTTFSIFHHTAFAVAVGLFAATARNIAGHQKLFRQKTYKSFTIGLLLALVIAAITVAILGARQQGGLRPTYLDAESRREAYTLESKTRGPKGVALSPAEVLQYTSLIGWKTDQEKVRLWDGNSLAFVSVIIDCVFGSFIAVFFWYVLVASVRTYLRIEDHRDGTLLALFACLCFWFPLRIYGTWYERHFFSKDWLSDYAALNFMLALFFVVGSLIALLLVRNTTAAWISGGVSAAAGGLALVSKIQPELFGGVAASVEPLHPFHVLLLGVLLLLVLGVFVLRVVHDLGESKLQEAKNA